MGKKVIKLTEQQLNDLITEATNRVIQEMDSATYSRIYNSSQRAMRDIQQGNFNRTTNGKKFVDNDKIISRANNLEPLAQKHWLADFVGKTFKFFGRTQMGLVAHVLFTFERITKFESNKTILVGEITFNQNQISGDGITIDFSKNTVKYHERGSRNTYNLDIDIRYKQSWDSFMDVLRTALESRNE